METPVIYQISEIELFEFRFATWEIMLAQARLQDKRKILDLLPGKLDEIVKLKKGVEPHQMHIYTKQKDLIEKYIKTYLKRK